MEPQNQQPREQPQPKDFAIEDLHLYVYGSRESDQFWLPNGASHSRRPVCLTTIPEFTFDEVEGDNEDEEQKQPIPNPLFNKAVLQIACGGLHSVILTTDGKVFTMGCNDEGALGRRGTQCIPLDVQLQDPVDMVAAGDNHSLFANSHNGAIYFAGNYNYKRGEKMTTSVYEPVRTFASEINITNKNKPIQKITCGANHSIVLINNRVYCRGQPEASTTGRRVSKRHTIKNSLTFNGVAISHVEDVECGGYHTIAKCRHGNKVSYYAWGTNDMGQLGVGNYEKQPFPVEIQKLRNVDIKKIAAGNTFTLFLAQNGDVFGCGSNEDGNLGLGEDYVFEPSEKNSSEEQQQSESEPVVEQKQAPIVPPAQGPNPVTGAPAEIKQAVSNNEQTNKDGSDPTKQAVSAIGGVEINNDAPVQTQVKEAKITNQAQQAKESKQGNEAAVEKEAVNVIESATKKQISPAPKQEEDESSQQKGAVNRQQNLYIKSIRKIGTIPEHVKDISCGENFAFAWTHNHLYSWGFGNSYVLLNGQEEDELTPFLVKDKIINYHSIYNIQAGSQHVLYLSYPQNVIDSTVKVEPQPNVWQNLSAYKRPRRR